MGNETTATNAHKQTVHRALAALAEGDVEGFLDDVTDDFVFNLAGSPPGGNTLQGKKPMIELLKMIFGGHLERGAIAMTVERMICEGDYLVEQATGKAKTLGGEPYDNTYCRIWHFRDGKIDSLLEFMDTELARRCLWT